MTKRHGSLIPLTHDHHHALVQARALMAAADEGEEERRRVAGSFLVFYEKDTLLHFHEEEEVLFPLLLEQVDEVPDELVRALVEHVKIHGMVSRLGAASSEGVPEGRKLRELGETLRSHVRLEENRLFPLIERVVTEASLSRLSFAERDRTQ